MADVFSAVVGQDDVVRQLRAATAAPVHAYLLVGLEGAGARAAAVAFSAALLCPNGGDGTCRDCRLALAGEHPDALTYAPEGAFLRVGDAEEIVRLAMRSPVEGARKVLILTELHRIQNAGPALLKTIEEPPASTVFVCLAEHVPPELVTIASRCVRIDVPPLAPRVIEQQLVAEGHDPVVAETAAASAVGSLDRARLLAADPAIAARRQAWAHVPKRLDGTGAAVAVVVEELQALVTAAAEPLVARQAAEAVEMDERIAAYGARGSGKKALEDQHKREQRRHRAEELRFGLATLAGTYRDALAGGAARAQAGGSSEASEAAAIVSGLRAIDAAAEALTRNPNETLLLQSLLLKLPSLG